jgi:hypothetical protein
VFHRHGLTCEPVGEVTEAGQLTLARGGSEAIMVDLATEAVTGLWI